MKALSLTALFLTLAMLAACGGSQPPIGAPGAMPQTATLQSQSGQRDESGSWMLAEARHHDLLYTSSPLYGVYVFTYPEAKLVGHLAVYGGYLCSDSRGHVWVVTEAVKSTLLIEYAHGGKKQIASLTFPDSLATGCAVDPTTGNLAVVTLNDQVGIYAGARGDPTIITGSYFDGIDFCGYDNNGNLFVDGRTFGSPYIAFAELPRGGDALQAFSINGSFADPGPIQWDGQYLATAGSSDNVVDRIAVSGSTGTIEGTTQLNLRGHDAFGYYDVQWWIQRGEIVWPFMTKHPTESHIGFWRYPAGGDSVNVIRAPGGIRRLRLPLGVTVSIAPH